MKSRKPMEAGICRVLVKLLLPLVGVAIFVLYAYRFPDGIRFSASSDGGAMAATAQSATIPSADRGPLLEDSGFYSPRSPDTLLKRAMRKTFEGRELTNEEREVLRTPRPLTEEQKAEVANVRDQLLPKLNGSGISPGEWHILRSSCRMLQDRECLNQVSRMQPEGPM